MQTVHGIFIVLVVGCLWICLVAVVIVVVVLVVVLLLLFRIVVILLVHMPLASSLEPRTSDLALRTSYYFLLVLVPSSLMHLCKQHCQWSLSSTKSW